MKKSIVSHLHCRRPYLRITPSRRRRTPDKVELIMPMESLLSENVKLKLEEKFGSIISVKRQLVGISDRFEWKVTER